LINGELISPKEEVATCRWKVGCRGGRQSSVEDRRPHTCGPNDVDRGERSCVVGAAEKSIVKLRSLAIFAVGYVLGTRAGRERYEQVIAAAQRASKRLEDYSGTLGTISGKIDSFSERVDGFKARLRDYSGG
jgi:hypothetical protein